MKASGLGRQQRLTAAGRCWSHVFSVFELLGLDVSDNEHKSQMIFMKVILGITVTEVEVTERQLRVVSSDSRPLVGSKRTQV